MIQICNWLLTRVCNLRCDYCRIVKNYDNKPDMYPDMSYYYSNEMSSSYITLILEQMKIHNPNMFHIFYGGEPLLYEKISEVIEYCNFNGINYTIISNNYSTSLLSKLLLKVNYLKGYTASVDPIIMRKNPDKESDRFKKSEIGFEKLISMSNNNKIKDLVAEMTICKEDTTSKEGLDSIVKTISELSHHNITTDITFVDISKNRYYDFSAITSNSELVDKSYDVFRFLNKCISEGKVHMPELYEDLFNALPSNFDCELEKDIHNITIDSDGKLRLCLRIRGVASPLMDACDLLWKDNISHFKKYVEYDKKKLCKGCNWSCMMMSKRISKEESTVNSLLHK